LINLLFSFISQNTYIFILHTKTRTRSERDRVQYYVTSISIKPSSMFCILPCASHHSSQNRIGIRIVFENPRTIERFQIARQCTNWTKRSARALWTNWANCIC